MAKKRLKKEDSREKPNYDISVGFIKQFTFNDTEIGELMKSHPKEGRLYQIVHDPVYGYRVHIGKENTNGRMEGILLGEHLTGDHNGRWMFDIAIVTKENFIDFDICEEDTLKLRDWFETDNAQLRASLEKPVAAVVRNEMTGALDEYHLQPNGQEVITTTAYEQFSDSINTIAEKEPLMFDILQAVTNYVASTYSDKYEATDKTNYGKNFLLESKSPDTAIFNTMKYIQRYATTGFEKSGNTKDIFKAIHYLLFELQRKAING